MSDIITVAIDSLPIAASLHNTYDYSGNQIFGLTQTTLGDLISLGHLRVEANSKYIISIPNTLTWEDGTNVTGHDYKRGLQNVLINCPLISKFNLRNLKSIECDNETLTILLSRPHQYIEEILSLKNISPIHNDEDLTHSSGSYTSEWNNEAWVLSHKSKKEPSIHFRHVQTPKDNLDELGNLGVDFTADTAFDFEKSNLEPEVCFNGLLFQCNFGGIFTDTKFSNERKIIKEILENVNLEGVFNEFYYPTNRIDSSPKVEFKEVKNNNISCPQIKIAYDDFYPNAEIVESLIASLRSNGVDAVAVVDDFYAPHVSYDIKLMISQELVEHDYMRFSSFVFNPILQSNDILWKRYCMILGQLENKLIYSKNGFQLLQDILDKMAVVVPLAKCPSCILGTGTIFDNPAMIALRRKNLK